MSENEARERLSARIAPWPAEPTDDMVMVSVNDLQALLSDPAPAVAVGVEGLIQRARYRINNPSAWDYYDDGASELIRELVAALTVPSPSGGDKESARNSPGCVPSATTSDTLRSGGE